jgi:ribosome-binding protein aMBF1 (putative translation factor)
MSSPIVGLREVNVEVDVVDSCNDCCSFVTPKHHHHHTHHKVKKVKTDEKVHKVSFCVII